jgi:hypothetical protein
VGLVLLGTSAVSPLYVEATSAVRWPGLAIAVALVVAGSTAYLSLRPAARRLVWPTR